MRKIKLGNSSLVAFVDAKDWKRVSSRNWYVVIRSGYPHLKYAHSAVWDPETKKKSIISMHRFIMDAKSGQEVDHIDGNGLNNTRKNLRICTRGANCQNRKRWAKSGFKGVYPYNKSKLWVAKIRINKELITLGTFTDPKKAAEAYDRWARRYWGKNARTNF